MPKRRSLREPQPLLPNAPAEPLSPTAEQTAWALDQLAKSLFFQQKMRAWDLLPVAEAIEALHGENLEWHLPTLGISQKAWDKVIHRGIKPVRVFAHPYTLQTVARAVGYYRMLAMVSQKSMNRLKLTVARYEEAADYFPGLAVAQNMAERLNGIISQLIEHDAELDPRAFDLWRGMAAGAQAQGSWQNAKGDTIETLVKTQIRQHLLEHQWVVEPHTEGPRLRLVDGREVHFADDPDVAVYAQTLMVAAVEIKGGIDVAGVLERIGAALKSLSRAKEANPHAVTILVLPEVSLTPQAENDLRTNQAVVDHWLTVESVVEEAEAREKFFSWLGF